VRIRVPPLGSEGEHHRHRIVGAGMAYKEPSQQRNYQATWMWRRRLEWIVKNGPCAWCGTGMDLRVVYKDPVNKTVRVTAIWSRREEVREELLKLCMVLCGPCAKSKRTEERQPDHGEVGRYDQGCRCVPCREAKRVSMAAYRARKKEKIT
jgi:hypothetical protein